MNFVECIKFLHGDAKHASNVHDGNIGKTLIHINTVKQAISCFRQISVIHDMQTRTSTGSGKRSDSSTYGVHLLQFIV